MQYERELLLDAGKSMKRASGIFSLESVVIFFPISVSDPCKAFNDLSCSHFCLIKNNSAECGCKLGFYLEEDKQNCTGTF